MYRSKVSESINDAIKEYKTSGYSYGVISATNNCYASADISEINNLILCSDGSVNINKLNISNSNKIHIRGIDINNLYIKDSTEVYIYNSRVYYNIVIVNSRVNIIGHSINRIDISNSSIVNITRCSLYLSYISPDLPGINVTSESLLNINLSYINSKVNNQVEYNLFFLADSNLNITDSNILAENSNIFYLTKSKLLAKRLDISGNNNKLLKLINKSRAEFYELSLDYDLAIDNDYSGHYIIHSRYLRNKDLLEIDKIHINSISTNVKYIYKNYTVDIDDHTLIVITAVNIYLQNNLNDGTILIIANKSAGYVTLFGNIDNTDKLKLEPNNSITLQYSGESGVYHVIKLNYIERSGFLY